MRIDREYHHFKGKHLSRSEWVERFVVQELIRSPLNDEERESSQAWELMHSSTCKAFMHVIAEKRNLPVELCRVAGALHDYYVIKTGKYLDHARRGAPLVGEVLGNHGGFSEGEIRYIQEMVEHHSDKQTVSDDAHVELMKDVDVFDCSLYHGTEFYYLTVKPLPVCHKYFERVLAVRRELGMPLPSAYRCLSRDHGTGLGEMSDCVETLAQESGPTVYLLALWALAVSPEASEWPLLILSNRNGEVNWHAPLSILATEASAELPSWNAIRATYSESRACVDSAGSACAVASVPELMEKFRQEFERAWVGYSGVVGARERAALALRDFACDPLGDERVKSLVRGRLMEALGNSVAPVGDEGERSPDRTVSVGPSWELEELHLKAIDELARVRALCELRGEVASGVCQALRASGAGIGNDLVWRFPAEAFGCEPCPVPKGPGESWVAVAWPRFKRFEFLVGAEAEDRFGELADYFSTPEREQPCALGHQAGETT